LERRTFKEAGKKSAFGPKPTAQRCFDDFTFGADSKISSADQLEKESGKKGAKGEGDDDDDKK